MPNRQDSMTGQSGAAVIKEGFARVKEDGLFAQFKSKYLVLREYRLDVHKDKTGKVSLTIPLRDVVGVTRSDTARMCFELVRLATPTPANQSVGVRSRDQPTKLILCEVRTDEEIYEWIDAIYARSPGMGGVSNPTNFTHRVHVGFDAKSGAFIGLPVEWEKLLTNSAITEDDYRKNPQAVLEVLNFYTDIQKRAENPTAFSSLTPSPPVQTNQNMQIGHGGYGSSIAPPRPGPPGGLQRVDSSQSQQTMRSQNNTPVNGQGRSPMGRPMEQQHDAQAQKAQFEAEQRRMMEIEAKKIQEEKRQREQRLRMQAEQEEAERKRREDEEYNASLPKTRVPTAKQELGGYGGDYDSGSEARSSPRYNPTRAAPQAPGGERTRQQPPGSLRQMTAQRPAPSAPNAQKSADGANGLSLRTATKLEQTRQPSPNPRVQGPGPDARNPSPQTNGTTPPQNQQPRGPGPVQPTQPLVVAQKNNTPPVNAQQTQAQAQLSKTQAALTKKPDQKKEVRMSSMSEHEVMEKLKQVVSKENPLNSYSKQKKIGQGASGSVYVARVKDTATSRIAQEVTAAQGPRGQVAIKQMDLRNQPRKELIVNEIIVMKDSKHRNIVNFLDSFLMEGNQELWVVMEYMDAGALTDVIDNNTNITEPQIATICFEVRAA